MLFMKKCIKKQRIFKTDENYFNLKNKELTLVKEVFYCEI